MKRGFEITEKNYSDFLLLTQSREADHIGQNLRESLAIVKKDFGLDK